MWGIRQSGHPHTSDRQFPISYGMKASKQSVLHCLLPPWEGKGDCNRLNHGPFPNKQCPRELLWAVWVGSPGPYLLR